MLTGWLVASAQERDRVGAEVPDVLGRESDVLHSAAAFATAGNSLTLVLLASFGVVLLVARERLLKGPDATLFSPGSVRTVAISFVVTSGAGLIATFSSRAGRLERSVLAVTAAVILPLTVAVAALLGPINAVASSTPLIEALERQSVEPDSIALYSCPNLWSRNFPRRLERVRYVGADVRDAAGRWPLIVATARSHAAEIAPALSHYRQIDEVRMIGKWFDVYRLR
jgi:hypothetical protein